MPPAIDRRPILCAVVLLASSSCGAASDQAVGDAGAAPPRVDAASAADAGAIPDGASTVDASSAVDAHVVAACNALGAAGVWQLDTPPQIPIVTDAPIGNFGNGSAGMSSVKVDPHDPSIVYAMGGHQTCCGSGSDGLFKSTDCGATWNKLDTGRNGARIDTGWIWYGGLLVDPTNTQVMYAESGYGAEGLWKSTNGGVDWDNLFAPDSGVAQVVDYGVFAEDTAMDPGDPAHLVMTYHTNCSGLYAPMCMGETMDGGATWRLFKGPPGLTGWQEGAGAVVMDRTTFLYAAPFDGLYYTHDGGGTWEKVADSGYFQMYTRADGTMLLGSNSNVLTSKDGHVWTPIPGTPKATNIIGDGVNLYATFTNDSGGQPIWSAPESDPTHWTQVKTPTMSQGGDWLSYDPDHHVLYVSAANAGLYRVVTR
jgi:hypothetical protein